MDKPNHRATRQPTVLETSLETSNSGGFLAGPRRRSSQRNRDSLVRLLVLLPVLFLGFVARPAEALAVAKRPPSAPGTAKNSDRIGGVVVAPVEVPPSGERDETGFPALTPDIVALAGLRYDEWIAASDDDDEVVEWPTSNEPPPSRRAFCMATAEITSERSAAGAVAFLARSRDGSGEAVGAAELTPIDLGAAAGDDDRARWYVTDVVTSEKHRRMGIAGLLMDAVEKHAYNNNDDDDDDNGTPVTLYLHVKPENDAALAFYQDSKRGYAAPTPDELVGLDAEKLAEILLADRLVEEGQILLCKTLTIDNLPGASSSDSKRGGDPSSSTTGFGMGSTKKKPKKKAKRKRK